MSPVTGPAVRRALNWTNLSTPLGLGIARWGGADITRGDRLLWHATGYRPSFPIASAFTVGDVVITGRTFDDLARHLPRILVHEERHSWQWAALGPAFLPLYLACTAWSWARTGDTGSRNLLERAAGLADGGYSDRPTLSWRSLPGRVCAAARSVSRRSSRAGRPYAPGVVRPATGAGA